MPWNCVIDKERRLIVTTGWDRVTFTEAKSHNEQLQRDPDFDPEFNQLIDLSGVTRLEFSTGEAKIMASRALFSSGSRRAFVATKPEIFSMGRLMQTYHKMAKLREEVRTFYDLDEARKWLGAPR
ncbi:MAG: hypothetical protein ACLQBK_02600 [Candidatus Sulfotelmatobacter sp.]